MHALNDFFDEVWCINLNKRKDRKEKIVKRFDELGINVKFYTTVEYGFNKAILSLLKKEGHDFVYPNELGCALSHYTIVKMAKENNLKNVFIFEDDTIFHQKFNELLPIYLDKLPHNWDLFYLYQLQYKYNNNFDLKNKDSILWKNGIFPYLFNPHASHCASAYGIHYRMFDEIISYMDNNFEIIDAYYRKLQDNKLYKIYSTYPNLTAQETNLSDIRNGICDYFGTVNQVVTSFGNETKDKYF